VYGAVPPAALTVALPVGWVQDILVWLVIVVVMLGQMVHGSKPVAFSNFNLLPAASVTRIGKVPGGVAVLLVENVVQVVSAKPAQINGIQLPSGQPVQF
jgi:hypothetical protein